MAQQEMRRPFDAAHELRSTSGAPLVQPSPSQERVRVLVTGAVQGVGFRPFVYRLARALDLHGFVENGPHGVTLEAQGVGDAVAAFVRRLRDDAPPRARVAAVEAVRMPLAAESAGFEIRSSEERGRPTAVVLPDLASCGECLQDVQGRTNRRHRYPFTNCTNCGPRYSIIAALPYDRARTTLAAFTMCPACRAEYEDPNDRRFHAEPNACPECGPQLALTDPHGHVLARRDRALLAAADALRRGRLLAIKGIGGYHLMADARDESALRRLRLRKHREAKPFAVMAPSLAAARELAILDAQEEALLASPEAPIVLVSGRAGALPPSIAPDNPDLGVMLPYTPLHHLLLAELGFPVVATSGNLSDEPLCYENRDALHRLAGIADLFLSHDRGIVRPIDDSVVRVIAGVPTVLRRGRGYAPFPIATRVPLPPLLAVGGHMKNTVAVSVGGSIVTSPHIGDLDSEPARDAFGAAVHALCRLYDVVPRAVACDAHPDYASSAFARERGARVIPVQHHHAHALACLTDAGLEAPAAAITWDGTGLGTDGTIWGGEALRLTATGFERVAWLLPFPLPGGDAAAREPRRSALGALFAADPDAAAELALFRPPERRVLLAAIRGGVNACRTSSAGRLFDAVSALLGLRSHSRFEGEAAMALEFAARGCRGESRYEHGLVLGPGDTRIVDWRPMLRAILRDRQAGLDVGEISLRFHNTLAEIVVAMARHAGEASVLLTGGCFQNRMLSERAAGRLDAEGFRPFLHRRLPPGDGALAVGQIVAAAQTLAAWG